MRTWRYTGTNMWWCHCLHWTGLIQVTRIDDIRDTKGNGQGIADILNLNSLPPSTSRMFHCGETL